MFGHLICLEANCLQSNVSKIAVLITFYQHQAEAELT